MKKQLQCSYQTFNNNGNPNGIWIEDCEGRMLYESDGFSEETSLKKSLTKSNNSGYSASSVLSQH